MKKKKYFLLKTLNTMDFFLYGHKQARLLCCNKRLHPSGHRCVQDIYTRNALYSNSNTSHYNLGVKIQLYVVHKMIINAKSILAQTEGKGTVFLQHSTDFQSKIFECPTSMNFKHTIFGLSINTSI